MYKKELIILMLALSCNLDNIAIGTSYGIRKIRLPWLSNLLIAFLTGTGTWVFIVFGQKIVTIVSPEIAVMSASLILIAMGLWVLWQEFFSPQTNDADIPDQPVQPRGPGGFDPPFPMAADDKYP